MRGCSGGGVCGCTGGDMHGCTRGACMVLFGGVCVVLFGGACMVLFGGACVVLFGGTCIVLFGGACMVLFGAHAWFYSAEGACMVLFSGGGLCMVFSVFSDTMRYGQWVGGTHSTGMHSCFKNCFIRRKFTTIYSRNFLSLFGILCKCRRINKRDLEKLFV